MNRNTELLVKGMGQLNINLSDMQINKFNDYYELLIERNKVMNLTAITDYEEVLRKHFIDSLTCVKVVELNQLDSVIDIGTGAGFPGLPLKIVFPHLSVTLVDSLAKRINFLNETIDCLDLNKIKAIHGRAEELAKIPEHREAYDLCVSRAVANYTTLLEYCLPFVRLDGVFIAYKSLNIDEEIKESSKALHVIGGKIDAVNKFKLPDTDIGRTLIAVKKYKSTPKKFPRRAGLPNKDPIK